MRALWMAWLALVIVTLVTVRAHSDEMKCGIVGDPTYEGFLWCPDGYITPEQDI